MDREIGSLLEHLEKSGRAVETVILFTSDNGFYLGDRGLSDKWFMHEESIRVPLLITDPRLPPGRRGVRTEAIVLNIDVAPTILDLAGIEPSSSAQGRSLRPFLMGASPDDWRTDFLYEHRLAFGGAIRIPQCEGVRERRWKFSRYPEEQPVLEQLFDLEQDPLERHDLAGSPEAASELERLRERCGRLAAQSR
jgi:arylsulfatase A-like enzyme